jgi:hypothetical protein
MYKSKQELNAYFDALEEFLEEHSSAIYEQAVCNQREHFDKQILEERQMSEIPTGLNATTPQEWDKASGSVRKRQAYKEGASAFELGKSVLYNPYRNIDANGVQWHAWQAGWKDASLDSTEDMQNPEVQQDWEEAFYPDCVAKPLSPSKRKEWDMESALDVYDQYPEAQDYLMSLSKEDLVQRIVELRGEVYSLEETIAGRG